MTTPSTKQIRIFLVDDHAMVRAGLRLLIESQHTLNVVGEANSSASALEGIARERPDVILLDVDLGGESGLDLLSALLDEMPEARVLLLTGVRDAEVHRRAVKLGAMGVVLKEETGEIILKAIEKVYAGEIWLDRATTASLLREMTRRKADEDETDAAARLTERERQIVALVGEGLKNKQIGDRLFISETTVSHHLTSIFAKLGVPDRLSLVFFAYRHRLAKPPF